MVEEKATEGEDVSDLTFDAYCGFDAYGYGEEADAEDIDYYEEDIEDSSCDDKSYEDDSYNSVLSSFMEEDEEL